MRDINRIPEMLAVLQELWEVFPDMRLGQLLENFAFDANNMFFQEDEVTLEKLDHYLLLYKQS